VISIGLLLALVALGVNDHLVVCYQLWSVQWMPFGEIDRVTPLVVAGYTACSNSHSSWIFFSSTLLDFYSYSALSGAVDIVDIYIDLYIDNIDPFNR
jgi:hypothetical protein